MKEFLILFFLMVAELILESWVAKKYYQSKGLLFKIFRKRQFSIWKYLCFFVLPFATAMAFILQYDYSAVLVFIIFAIVGTFLEGLAGFAYHRVVGKRLWVYDQANIYGYTSWLSAPMWGLIGVCFWFLNQAIKL